jgi:PAS domain S-box-containing protein
MNRAAERLTRWAEKKALGHAVEDVFRVYDAKTRLRLENPVRKSLGTRASVRLSDTAVLATQDGRERDVIDSTAPILDADGRVEGAVLAFQDVTRARRDHNWLAFMYEASLLLAQSLDYETTLARVTRLAVTSLADVCVVDILQPDGSLRRLAGSHADPAKQPLVDDLVRVSRLDPEALDEVGRAVRTGQPALFDLTEEATQTKLARLASNREYFHARKALDLGSGLIVPLLVENSRTLGAIVLASRGLHRFEVSDVQRAEQLAHCFALAIDDARLHREVKDSLAMREEFLKLLAHELRTPITALQLDLAALDRGSRAQSDPANADRLTRAMDQVRRLVNLAENLLDAALLSPESVVLHLEDADLRQVVAEAVQRYRHDARHAPVFELQAGPPVVWRCDPRLMARALASLLANAAKFGRGRPIEVSVEASGDAMARIRVIDHGIGISPEDVPRIFEPFERAVSSQQYGGLGLGLHVARGIVQAHGGSILVSSRCGAGSTFTLLLPARREG